MPSMFDLYLLNQARQQGAPGNAQQAAPVTGPSPMDLAQQQGASNAPPPGAQMGGPAAAAAQASAPEQSIWDKLRARVISERNLNFGDPNAPWTADAPTARSASSDQYTAPSATPAVVASNPMLASKPEAYSGSVDALKDGWAQWLAGRGWMQ